MAFQPHSSFDALASVIEQFGADGRTVRRAEAAAGDEDDALCATVDVAVPLSDLSSSDGSGTIPLDAVDDAEDPAPCFGLRIPGLDATSIAGTDETDVAVRGVEATLDAEAVVATLEVVIRSIEPDTGGAGGRSRGSAAVDGEPFTRGSDRTDGDPDPAAVDATDAYDGSVSVGPADGERANADWIDDAERGGDDLASVRDESVPPYEDTAYLARLYESCETFAEMSERIEMDVSAETVRRYMIDAGVHSPTSYELGERDGPSADREATERDGRSDREAGTTDGGSDESADGDEGADGDPTAEESDDGGDDPERAGGEAAATGAPERERTRDRVASESLPDEQLVADGIGLPEALTLPEVVEAVVGARTVYEVERHLGLGHDRTRQLLRQLNVLDLVLCRASAAEAREVSVETVARRIRQCTPDGA